MPFPWEESWSAMPQRANNWDVARNAIVGGIASVPDAIINTPNRLQNLDRAARGTITNAIGRPDLSPDIKADPDYVRKLFERIGLIKEGVQPSGNAQKWLDIALRGASGGVATGGTGLPNVLAGAANGALSSSAAAAANDLGAPLPVQIMAGAAAPSVAARLARPMNVSSDVKTLLDSDVVPSPGQLFGKNSTLNRMEQALESYPVIGALPRGARNRAQTEFNRAELNLGVPKGQAPVRSVGSRGLDDVEIRTDANFDKMLAGRTLAPDATLARDLLASAKSTRLPLSADGAKKFNSILDSLVWQRIPTQNIGQGVTYSIPASDFKSSIIGDIGREARNFSRMSNSDDRAIGAALQEARNRANDWMTKNVGAPSRDVAEADRAYKAFASAKDAGERGLANDMMFTPYQMLKSAPKGSQSYNLAAAAQNVLPNTLPNSGTADRALLASILTAGAPVAAGVAATNPGLVGQAASMLQNPLLWAPLSAGALAYTRPGSKYLGGGYKSLSALSDALKSRPVPALYGLNAELQE